MGRRLHWSWADAVAEATQRARDTGYRQRVLSYAGLWLTEDLYPWRRT